ncbi:MAG: DUF4465 domain-containing protein [Muribaculaceae bacterium]|nr:DUF4465 domain-containing protein [Muribaculaceae bacterium]
MKLLKTLLATTAVASVTLIMSSCSDHDDNGDSTLLLPFVNSNIKFDAETQAWDECYNESAADNLNYVDFHFSHSANEQWQSWYGFCPTRSTDNGDHPDDWIQHQWGSITGGGVFSNVPYMLCFWDSYGEMEAMLNSSDPSLSIKLNNNNYNGFYPKSISITNSAYGYYAIKNGTAFNRKFEPGDRFSVVIIGRVNGVVKGQVEFVLAEGQDILKEWKDCDLRSLGKVDELYFRMRSTDTGMWGINNPTYFCMDNFQFSFTE